MNLARVGGRPLIYGGLMLLAIVLVTLHVRAVTALSPLDEFQHADAFHRAIGGHVTRTGDIVDAGVRAEAACRGIETVKLPPCGSGQPALAYPGAGFDTADIHPPGYYFITAWLSAPLRLLGVGEIDAGRLVGGLWLGLGLVLLWEVAGALGASRAANLACCVLAASTSSVLEASSSLGPDNTAMAAGGLAILAVIRVEEGRWPLWTLVVTGLFAGVTKAHNLVGIGAAAVQRLVPVTGRGGGLRSGLISAALLAGAAAAAQAVWLLVRHALRQPTPMRIPLGEAEFVKSLPIRDVLVQVTQFFTPVNSPYTPALLNQWQVGIAHYVLNLLLVGAVLGAVFFLPTGTRARAVAIGLTVMALVGAPLLVVATFLTSHSFVPSFPRYGLSLLPGMFALLAVGAGRRLPLPAVIALAAVSLAGMLVFLVPAALR